MGVEIKIEDSWKNDPPKIKILYFNISHFSHTTQFLICCAVVFLFFIVYGYMQELIFTLDGFQPYGWYLTLVQFGYYSIFGLIEKYVNKIQARKYVFIFVIIS